MKKIIYIIVGALIPCALMDFVSGDWLGGLVSTLVASSAIFCELYTDKTIRKVKSSKYWELSRILCKVLQNDGDTAFVVRKGNDIAVLSPADLDEDPDESPSEETLVSHEVPVDPEPETKEPEPPADPTNPLDSLVNSSETPSSESTE